MVMGQTNGGFCFYCIEYVQGWAALLRNISWFALWQELFGLTILSVFYLVHNGFNLSYMAQLEMVLPK